MPGAVRRVAPIDASPTCDRRLAAAVVLHKLWRRCTAPGCDARFWRAVHRAGNATTVATLLDAVVRDATGPGRITDATIGANSSTFAHGTECLRTWRTFGPPAPACVALLAHA